MKNECCKFLLHQIAFYNDVIRPCCSFSIEKHKLFQKTYSGDIGGIKEYLKTREEYIKDFKEKGIAPCFKDCTVYENETENDISFKINNLIISHRTYCSCNCIYCEPSTGNSETRKDVINKKRHYAIKPILKYLYTKNLIENDCRFLICGGECSEYPKDELAYLLYFAAITNCQILILSSGINYSREIENALQYKNTVLKISVDSGTRKTFEKIKRVKKYYETWKNIKKYIKASKKNKFQYTYVELKYIVIPGVNDTISEASAFVKKCREVKCQYVRIDVEHFWIEKNKDNIKEQESIKKTINYFFDTLYNDSEIKIDFEGVYKDWLWSFVKDKYTIPQIGR